MADFVEKDKALECIEQHFAGKDAKWSLDVKANAGWRCQTEGCQIGTFNRRLLNSHHIKPVSQFPELRNDLDNGKCLCIYHHGLAHSGWVRRLIWARGFFVLLCMQYPQRKAEFERAML